MPLGTALVVARRGRGDGMPTDLWADVEPDWSADKLVFRASAAHQMTMPAFVVCLAERRKRPLIDGFVRAAEKRSRR